MSFTTLPAPASVSVSAATRLSYVLRHFQLAYPGAPAVAVGYPGDAPQVEIIEAGEFFFASENPCPLAPNWREWCGQQVPFFFDKAPEKPLLVFEKNRVIILADIISAAFYLLSGWQEYFSPERDQHGRFPYAASVQANYDFVMLPVVNYYFDVLKTAVEYISGQPLRLRKWGANQAEFAAFISHDVDNMRNGWKAPAKAALRQGQFGRFGHLFWQHLTQPDPWDNLEAVAAITAQYGSKSTFFMLPVRHKALNGVANADYRLTSALRQQLTKLATQGCEIGLHGSIGTATEHWSLRDEAARLTPLRPVGLRLHYLCWEPRQTPEAIAQARFGYDATLGFAEHYGFRHSYCLPFYPFNLELGQAAEFLEIPLNVMDTTLHHPNYLQLKSDEILPALRPVFTEIRKFGGVASVLWHNQNFDPANATNGPEQFHEIMVHLRQQGAVFCTGREIWQEFVTNS